MYIRGIDISEYAISNSRKVKDLQILGNVKITI